MSGNARQVFQAAPPPPPPPSNKSPSSSISTSRPPPSKNKNQQGGSRRPAPPPPPPPPAPAPIQGATSISNKSTTSSNSNPFDEPIAFNDIYSSNSNNLNPFNNKSDGQPNISPLEAKKLDIYKDKDKDEGGQSNLSVLAQKSKSPYEEKDEVIEKNYEATVSEGNFIYHKLHFVDFWLVASVLAHIILFSLLLSMAKNRFSPGTLAVLVILVITVAVLLILGRWFIKKKTGRNDFKNEKLSPEDETDNVPNYSIKLFAWASVLEGISFAIFSSVTAGNQSDKDSSDIYHSSSAILQVLRFTSIVLLCFHRILRPANRADPLRTILELEVVSVCWDAIDGSTFYDLLNETQLTRSADTAARFLMVIWYLSVGVRLGLMFLVHLSPDSSIVPQSIMNKPLAMSPSPTVDRTVQSLRIRAFIILIMAAAEVYAVGLRIALWSTIGLSSVQQEMTVKNVLFLSSVVSAYSMWSGAELRNWNRADFFGYKIPSRLAQLEFYRWLFIISYTLLGIFLSLILIDVATESNQWVANIGSDFLLTFIFYYYYKFGHVRKDHQESTSYLDSLSFKRLEGYVLFPGRDAAILGAILSINMVIARLPALYRHANDIDLKSQWSYQDAMILIQLTIIPIFSYAMYWSLSLMLFRKEFTASPGNYNAIHDPMIDMVSQSIMIEGSLDVISAAAFMILAQNGLPENLDNLVITFALLEILNACQSFALQAVLSGGSDDTPVDLVKWKANLRMFRVPIDLGTFCLRVALWIVYKQSSVSVFLVKNLYNLLHTAALIERAHGVKKYTKGTLFTEFVSPQEWYGLSQSEWREATSETLAMQARAGRRV